ncbi:MAG: iron-sulfur cluster assembly scaffold protein [Gemmatimonadaceae bacterium]
MLEHFRRPRNRGSLDSPTAQSEGANPLCGDRVRVQLRVDEQTVVDARFTADACAICVASASVLTERVRGMSVSAAVDTGVEWLYMALAGEPPAARRKCALLPLETLARALADARRAVR